ncbi:MAG: hypothetical protein ACYSWU_29290 [Planctomycetota bacterium]|jgi:spore coat polysaccharide biosynthesis protein SpsF
MTVLAVIQARWNSSRFPGKVYGAIVGYCAVWGVDTSVLYGDDNDVLHRFVCATEECQDSDTIVRVCADNPLVWPGGIDALVRAAKEDDQADYVGYELAPGDPAIISPTGWFAEVARAGALRRLEFLLPREHPEREHVTQGLYLRAGIFRCRWLPLPDWWTQGAAPPNVAIDTPDDLRRVSDWLDDQAAERNGSPWK